MNASSRFVLSLVALVLLGGGGGGEALASPAPLDPALRLRLARLYAPEIRTDRRERYGLASPAYFIQNSYLMANLSGCSFAEKEGIRKAPLGEGPLLFLRDRIVWSNEAKGCARVYYPFVPGKLGGKDDRSAPGNLFFQLKSRSDDILLRDRHRFRALPEINFHIQKYAHSRCLEKKFLRGCKRTQTKDYYILQYFVFLMFNDACNVHEGEHEGLVVVVDAEAFQKAKTPLDVRSAVRRVGVYQHYKTKVASPQAIEWMDLTHPVVYMGAGGHGFYTKAGQTALLPGFPTGSQSFIQKICENRRRVDRLTEYHRGDGGRYRTWLPFGHPASFDFASPTSKESQAENGASSKPPKIAARPASRPAARKGLVSRALARPKNLVVRTVIRAGRSVVRSKKPVSTTDRILISFTPKEKETLAAIPALQARCLLSQGRPGFRFCDVMQSPLNDPCCFQDTYIAPYPRWIYFAGRWGEQELFSTQVQEKTWTGSLMNRLPIGHSFGDSGPFGPRFIHQSTWSWESKRFPDHPRSTPARWR